MDSRESPPTSGVERRRHQRALADRDDPTRGRAVVRTATTSTDSPADSTHGARDGVHRRAGHREVALEGVDLAAERVRRTVASRPPNVS